MPSPLPDAWVDRLFARFAVRYGAAWLRMWEGIDMAAVRQDWAEELAGLQDRPEALKYGLRYLPADKPPTVQQFRAQCNRAPEPAAPQLPAPPASADAVLRAISAIDRSDKPRNLRAWATRLQARHKAGERLTPAQVSAYRAALREPIFDEAAFQ